MVSLEDRARQVQAEANQRLAQLDRMEDPTPLIDEVLAGEWDYIDVTQFGRPRQILITMHRAPPGRLA